MRRGVEKRKEEGSGEEMRGEEKRKEYWKGEEKRREEKRREERRGKEKRREEKRGEERRGEERREDIIHPSFHALHQHLYTEAPTARADRLQDAPEFSDFPSPSKNHSGSCFRFVPRISRVASGSPRP
ncbi:inner centromere protein-like [Hemibagrus wyckioides]|uniref:inner centromere protein-like n=1 Tax=Hemibagrus wyckioides TaxID=337641 RepID=UPI00266B900E|nr:inner centromere protein-like [Hemibagrus wyckioides]